MRSCSRKQNRATLTDSTGEYIRRQWFVGNASHPVRRFLPIFSWPGRIPSIFPSSFLRLSILVRFVLSQLENSWRRGFRITHVLGTYSAGIARNRFHSDLCESSHVPRNNVTTRKFSMHPVRSFHLTLQSLLWLYSGNVCVLCIVNALQFLTYPRDIFFISMHLFLRMPTFCLVYFHDFLGCYSHLSLCRNCLP